MTRLTGEDLDQIPDDLESYDQRLKTLTGMRLLDLALKAASMTAETFYTRVADLTNVSIIPTTLGQGMLAGFSEKVAAIGRHLGLPCTVTKTQDVAGFGEAIAGGADIIVCADDDTFLALNLISRRAVDNSIATGQVYAAALDQAAGGIAGHKAAVLGLGPVGQASATWLRSRGAQVIVHDRDRKKQNDVLAAAGDWRGADGVLEVLNQTDLVIDATNAADIISVHELRGRLVLAAPGVPLGLDRFDYENVLLIHDPLQLGVAAMMTQVLT
jgi:pyrrolysine biosynthesis protein PylD